MIEHMKEKPKWRLCCSSICGNGVLYFKCFIPDVWMMTCDTFIEQKSLKYINQQSSFNSSHTSDMYCKVMLLHLVCLKCFGVFLVQFFVEMWKSKIPQSSVFFFVVFFWGVFLHLRNHFWKVFACFSLRISSPHQYRVPGPNVIRPHLSGSE